MVGLPILECTKSLSVNISTIIKKKRKKVRKTQAKNISDTFPHVQKGIHIPLWVKKAPSR